MTLLQRVASALRQRQRWLLVSLLLVLHLALVSGADYFRRFGWELLRPAGRPDEGAP